MSSAVHSDRAKEQIACKVFIQYKAYSGTEQLSVPLFFYLRNRISREVTVLTSSAKGSPSNGISSNALNTKMLQPKMVQTMLLVRRSPLRIARAAMVIDRFVMSL